MVTIFFRAYLGPIYVSNRSYLGWFTSGLSMIQSLSQWWSFLKRVRVNWVTWPSGLLSFHSMSCHVTDWVTSLTHYYNDLSHVMSHLMKDLIQRVMRAILNHVNHVNVSVMHVLSLSRRVFYLKFVLNRNCRWSPRSMNQRVKINTRHNEQLIVTLSSG